jgi:hypothetical protein
VARQAAQLILALALGALASLASVAVAQDLRTPQTPWRALSPEQQRILGPVAPEWERMPGYQQQRLMSAARQYPSLQPIQKERFDQRLRDWTTMTPEQRKAARETFQGMRKLPPEKQHELRERWLERHQEYPSGVQQQGRPGYAPQQYTPQQYAPPGYPAADQQRRYGEPPPQSRPSDGRGERRSREESREGQQGPRR